MLNAHTYTYTDGLLDVSFINTSIKSLLITLCSLKETLWSRPHHASPCLTAVPPITFSADEGVPESTERPYSSAEPSQGAPQCN